MSLQDFVRDWVPIMSLIVGALGLLSLGLVWYQLKLSTKWNKLQGQSNFLNRSLDEQEARLQAALMPLGIDFYAQIDKLTAPQAKAIRGNDEAYLQTKTYLNALEDIGAAVRIGFVDVDFAYALEGSRLMKAWRIFEPLALDLREYHSAPGIYIEMENVALAWGDRRAAERKAIGERRRSAQARIGPEPVNDNGTLFGIN